MSKYTTLVFKSDTFARADFVKKLANEADCRAWSTDHEILRLELIEQALSKNDVELAQTYISALDITKYSEDYGYQIT